MKKNKVLYFIQSIGGAIKNKSKIKTLAFVKINPK